MPTTKNSVILVVDCILNFNQLWFHAQVSNRDRLHDVFNRGTSNTNSSSTTSSKQKQTMCCATNIFNNLSLSTCLLDTCGFMSLSLLIFEWQHLDKKCPDKPNLLPADFAHFSALFERTLDFNRLWQPNHLTQSKGISGKILFIYFI